MTPDKIRAWLSRSWGPATRVRLVAEDVSVKVAIDSWSKEDCEAGDVAGQIIDAAQDYCDSRESAARFLIQRTDDACEAEFATIAHRAAPIEMNTRAAKHGDQANATEIVLAMLKHDEVKEKILVGALGTILQANQGVIKMQGEVIAQLRSELTAMHQQSRRRGKGADDEEDEESSLVTATATAAAINKLTDIAEAAAVHYLNKQQVTQ